MEISVINAVKTFGGTLKRCVHKSAVLGGLTATFSIFLPSASTTKVVPHIYFLSGLTCTDENFAIKSGAFRVAEQLSVAIVLPDTSPRGSQTPGEDDSWDFGTGAGFYVNATQDPWSKHYRMYSYIVEELPAVVNANFSVDPTKVSIMGHSMGGHGALTIGIKNADKFKSISAFAPISNPSICPWGIKALTAYIGDDKSEWVPYDATELVKTVKNLEIPILIDQGSKDVYFSGDVNQLQTENLINAFKEKKIPVVYHLRDGYDHSYYYIATFIEEHLKFHHKYLS